MKRKSAWPVSGGWRSEARSQVAQKELLKSQILRVYKNRLVISARSACRKVYSILLFDRLLRAEDLEDPAPARRPPGLPVRVYNPYVDL